MRVCATLLSVFFTLPAAAQTVPAVTSESAYLYADDCLYINDVFYMCDQVNAWETLELPEDLRGVGFEFEGEIRATVEIMASPWVGIQVRHNGRDSSPNMVEALVKVDFFPAITTIYSVGQGAQAVMVASTTLRLHELDLRAETRQTGNSYTPDHAARHAEMLAGITHEWSFD